MFQECIKPVAIDKTKSKTGAKITVQADGYYEESDVRIIQYANNLLSLLNNPCLPPERQAKAAKSGNYAAGLPSMLWLHYIGGGRAYYPTESGRASESAAREPGT